MTIRVSYEALKAEFKRVLLARKVKEETAEAVKIAIAESLSKFFMFSSLSSLFYL